MFYCLYKFAMKGIPNKLQRRCFGSFKIAQKLGAKPTNQNYLTHGAFVTFHVSLIKRWHRLSCRTGVEKVVGWTGFNYHHEISSAPVPFPPLAIYERYKRVLKRNGRYSHIKYPALWEGYPLYKAIWGLEANFDNKVILQHNLEEDKPSKVEP